MAFFCTSLSTLLDSNRVPPSPVSGCISAVIWSTSPARPPWRSIRVVCFSPFMFVFFFEGAKGFWTFLLFLDFLKASPGSTKRSFPARVCPHPSVCPDVRPLCFGLRKLALFFDFFSAAGGCFYAVHPLGLS